MTETNSDPSPVIDTASGDVPEVRPDSTVTPGVNPDAVNVDPNVNTEPAAPVTFDDAGNLVYDEGKQQSLSDAMREQWTGLLGDLTKAGQAALDAGAQYYLPQFARVAMLSASTDPKIKSLADRERRHLQGQLLMMAGKVGIPLQQKQEKRLLQITDMLLGIALKAI